MIPIPSFSSSRCWFYFFDLHEWPQWSFVAWVCRCWCWNSMGLGCATRKAIFSILILFYFLVRLFYLFLCGRDKNKYLERWSAAIYTLFVLWSSSFLIPKQFLSFSVLSPPTRIWFEWHSMDTTTQRIADATMVVVNSFLWILSHLEWGKIRINSSNFLFFRFFFYSIFVLLCYLFNYIYYLFMFCYNWIFTK